MTIGLVGRKVGMTRVFTEDGISTPVTVIEVEANRVAQVKTVDNDGYSALQVTTGKRKASRVTKPAAGHFAKAGIEAGRGLWEFRLNENEGSDIEAGSEITVDVFNDTKLVSLPVHLKVKVSKAVLSVGTLLCSMLLTVYLCHIALTVR